MATLAVMNTRTDFDIVIVGGGLAGGLAALGLAHSGFDCAVIDAQDPQAMRGVQFDGRTTALAYAAVRLFKRLGLWEAIENEAEPIRDILVTDGRAKNRFRDGIVSPFHLHFDSRELGPDTPLGWIVENRTMREAIFDAIDKTEAVMLFAPARRTAARFAAGGASVDLANGATLSAPLVVAADGRFSALRAEAGIKVNKWTYPQTGIVVTVAHERPHHGVAQEFFLPSGPFAILPLTENRSSLVWSEHRDAAPAYLKLDDAAFLRQIEARFGPYLGELSLASPRWSYPLAFHLAQSLAAPRMALIGDAAHAVHPIAGQGFNLGIKDIAALADVVAEARGLGLDIGHFSVLEKYQRWRRFDSTALALGMDLLTRLFSNDLAPVRFARDIGMNAVGKVAPLRRFFMRQAGADLGKLPSLMSADG